MHIKILIPITLASLQTIAAPIYLERITTIQCGALHLDISMSCQNSGDAFTAEHCKMPGVLNLQNKELKISSTASAPNLSKKEIAPYRNNKIYSVLYPRVLSCASINGKYYVQISYYGNEKQSPWNELNEYYSETGIMLTGIKTEAIAQYFLEHASKTASKFVDLNEQNN